MNKVGKKATKSEVFQIHLNVHFKGQVNGWAYGLESSFDSFAFGNLLLLCNEFK